MVETLVDQPNNLLSLWLDGVRFDQEIDLSNRLPLNRADLTLHGVDPRTAGIICIDELIYHDDTSPTPPAPSPLPSPTPLPVRRFLFNLFAVSLLIYFLNTLTLSLRHFTTMI